MHVVQQAQGATCVRFKEISCALSDSYRFWIDGNADGPNNFTSSSKWLSSAKEPEAPCRTEGFICQQL